MPHYFKNANDLAEALRKTLSLDEVVVNGHTTYQVNTQIFGVPELKLTLSQRTPASANAASSTSASSIQHSDDSDNEPEPEQAQTHEETYAGYAPYYNFAIEGAQGHLESICNRIEALYSTIQNALNPTTLEETASEAFNPKVYADVLLAIRGEIHAIENILSTQYQTRLPSPDHASLENYLSALQRLFGLALQPSQADSNSMLSTETTSAQGFREPARARLAFYTLAEVVRLSQAYLPNSSPVAASSSSGSFFTPVATRANLHNRGLTQARLNVLYAADSIDREQDGKIKPDIQVPEYSVIRDNLRALLRAQAYECLREDRTPEQRTQAKALLEQTREKITTFEQQMVAGTQAPSVMNAGMQSFLRYIDIAYAIDCVAREYSANISLQDSKRDNAAQQLRQLITSQLNTVTGDTDYVELANALLQKAYATLFQIIDDRVNQDHGGSMLRIQLREQVTELLRTAKDNEFTQDIAILITRDFAQHCIDKMTQYIESKRQQCSNADRAPSATEQTRLQQATQLCFQAQRIITLCDAVNNPSNSITIAIAYKELVLSLQAIRNDVRLSITPSSNFLVHLERLLMFQEEFLGTLPKATRAAFALKDADEIAAAQVRDIIALITQADPKINTADGFSSFFVPTYEAYPHTRQYLLDLANGVFGLTANPSHESFSANSQAPDQLPYEGRPENKVDQRLNVHGTKAKNNPAIVALRNIAIAQACVNAPAASLNAVLDAALSAAYKLMIARVAASALESNVQTTMLEKLSIHITETDTGVTELGDLLDSEAGKAAVAEIEGITDPLLQNLAEQAVAMVTRAQQLMAAQKNTEQHSPNPSSDEGNGILAGDITELFNTAQATKCDFDFTVLCIIQFYESHSTPQQTIARGLSLALSNVVGQYPDDSNLIAQLQNVLNDMAKDNTTLIQETKSTLNSLEEELGGSDNEASSEKEEREEQIIVPAQPETLSQRVFNCLYSAEQLGTWPTHVNNQHAQATYASAIGELHHALLGAANSSPASSTSSVAAASSSSTSSHLLGEAADQPSKSSSDDSSSSESDSESEANVIRRQLSKLSVAVAILTGKKSGGEVMGQWEPDEQTSHNDSFGSSSESSDSGGEQASSVYLAPIYSRNTAYAARIDNFRGALRDLRNTSNKGTQAGSGFSHLNLRASAGRGASADSDVGVGTNVSPAASAANEALLNRFLQQIIDKVAVITGSTPTPAQSPSAWYTPTDGLHAATELSVVQHN